ncbi:uncharacterized protein LOC129727380 [Wyeomyia smithii]|uniref:uncharacterized protein LOC129727378 n=1 Tax=Wyeomyia smithii TaxID=174621 RepID=UPI00246820B6|nr:uncharacterized protein LOC129727378 [Wyeomyia smithii]XP_055541155.1 uncharacterized protein LOC129727378 [Wyeomyia smithii]XP_055541158.1 uncharacterized protein LOC129727380 [Wyeomyia smithii]XP_055541159.1 uncharacterized protein LOC129727380 [Wyeomyia smithii]
MGTYVLKVRFPVLGLEEGGKALLKSKADYNYTCVLLQKIIKNTHCNVMLNDLEMAFNKSMDMNKFIKEFFPSRRTRGFITAIGGMDSDDRIRVDINLDKLRRNEESLVLSLDHQTATIDAMYKFVDSSMLHIDDKMKNVMNTFNTLGKLVQDDLSFASTYKKALQLESELIEIGFRIQSLINDLNKQQNIILQVLLNKDNSITWFIQLLEPAILLQILKEAESKIKGGLEFPRRQNSGILSEILRITDVSFKTENNQMLSIDLKIPLVSKRKFKAFKGSFIPQINGTIIMTINLDRNIIIEEIDSYWGFLLTATQYENCKIYMNFRICELKLKEENLTSENECLLNLRFRNSTENCKIKLLRVNHDAWFETEESNVWEYVTPQEVEVNIFHGENKTNLIVRGTGRMRLTPNMRIQTNNTKIWYSDTTVSDNKALVNTMNYKIMNFTWEESTMHLIPTLSGNFSKVSFYDRKKLFDLGIDVEVLKKQRPFLENLIYSPLSSGWTIASIGTGAIIMLATLIVLFICCFKGQISCPQNKKYVSSYSKERKSKPFKQRNPKVSILKKPRSSPPKIPLRGQKITHLGPLIDPREPNSDAEMLKRMKDIFANPNLEHNGEILLMRELNPQANLPAIQKLEEEYMEPDIFQTSTGITNESDIQGISENKTIIKTQTRRPPVRIRW